ncbi:MAG: hypothetical protein ABR591_00950 [Candidatus Velthaea sp.]
MMERNNGSNRSQFRDSAAEIHKAAEAELAKLAPAVPARPQGAAASPGPA